MLCLLTKINDQQISAERSKLSVGDYFFAKTLKTKKVKKKLIHKNIDTNKLLDCKLKPVFNF